MSNWLSIDRIIGLVLLTLSVFFVYQAFQLEAVIPPIFKRAPMRLDTMPKIIGVIAIIASIVTIIAPSTSTTAIKDDKVKAAKAKMADLSFDTIGQYAVGHLAAMVAMMCVYAIALRPLGFIPSTAIFLFLGSLLLGERRWLAMALVASIAPTSIWLLVTYVLERKIPAFPSFVGI